jgi:hypothetical protein
MHANAVTETDIKARFHPVLKFYTSRQTIKFGRMLKEKGISPYSHRGKSCYDLEVVISIPSYRTFEEAWAFARGFAVALPDLHVAHGVRFEGDERVWEDYGTSDSRYATLVMREEPDSQHGG